MIEELKTTAVALAAVESECAALAQRVAEATARRDTLTAEIEGLDTAAEAAETAHTEALAAVELGDTADTAATAAELAKARAALRDKPELIQQRRTADAVIDNLSRRQLEAQNRHKTLLDQQQAERIAAAEAKAQAAMGAVRDGIADVRSRIAEAQAARRVLEGVGGRWMLGWVDIHESTFNPDPAAVALIADGLRRELEVA